MQVIQEMAVGQGMKRFKMEYERLYAALVRAHESHRLLENRCKQLSEDAIANSGKIQRVVENARNDQMTNARIKAVRKLFYVSHSVVHISAV